MRKVLFQFSEFIESNLNINIEHWITLPLCTNVSQYIRQLTHLYNVPDVIFHTFSNKLSEFLHQENIKDFETQYATIMENLRDGTINIDEIGSRFHHDAKFTQSSYPMPNDEDIFSHAYSRMIHSPAAQDLVKLEQSFAIAIANELDKRDDALREMKKDLLSETKLGLLKRNNEAPQLITRLQESYYRSIELLESKCDSCISELKFAQRSALREFVMSVDEQLATSLSAGKTTNLHMTPNENQALNFKKVNSFSKQNRACLEIQEINEIPWSETFTVQLGRQFRTICNFRLTCLDPVKLLSDIGRCARENNINEHLAERMSNALSIYSNNLNGLVVLVDKRLNSVLGIKKYLAGACERSTEFHFPELGSQLSSIQKTINQLGPRTSLEQLLQSKYSSDTKNAQKLKAGDLEPMHGDVYITKHSNLIGGFGNGTNVIFHLVVEANLEDTVRAPSSLHCALSAIIRACFDYEITTLTLPLLFEARSCVHMDRTQRAKRAELVLKAIKGVLMELITWRGPTLRSLQFLAPSYLDTEELMSFGQIISSSFVQPNPLIVTVG